MMNLGGRGTCDYDVRMREDGGDLGAALASCAVWLMAGSRVSAGAELWPSLAYRRDRSRAVVEALLVAAARAREGVCALGAPNFLPVQNAALRRYSMHCDGLVFAPTDSSLYLFNPATRDAITLPSSRRNNLRAGGGASCYCAGLGLDPRTGKYKVVQAFYRSLDPDTGMGTDMGMEVFTVAGDDGGGWREITSNPPYPAKRF
jgi:hypothetical protein